MTMKVMYGNVNKIESMLLQNIVTKLDDINVDLRRKGLTMVTKDKIKKDDKYLVEGINEIELAFDKLITMHKDECTFKQATAKCQYKEVNKGKVCSLNKCEFWLNDSWCCF